jgi:hypothetical protein
MRGQARVPTDAPVSGDRAGARPMSGHVKDHIVPSRAGPDAPSNMQWQLIGKTCHESNVPP